MTGYLVFRAYDLPDEVLAESPASGPRKLATGGKR